MLLFSISQSIGHITFFNQSAVIRKNNCLTWPEAMLRFALPNLNKAFVAIIGPSSQCKETLARAL